MSTVAIEAKSPHQYIYSEVTENDSHILFSIHILNSIMVDGKVANIAIQIIPDENNPQ